MPLIHVVTSKPPAEAEPAQKLLRELSQTLARELSKPESYVMTCLSPTARMTFAGSDAPCCYAEVKNIGKLSPSISSHLSSVLCAKLSSLLDIPKDRIYIEFANVEPELWGYNGETFA